MKKLFVIAWTAENGDPMLDQQWIDVEDANQMLNVEIKRFMLGRKLGVPPMLLNESLVARTILQEGIPAPSEFHLIYFEDDFQPHIIGPFSNDGQRHRGAGDIKLRHGDDEGLFNLNIIEGVVSIAELSSESITQAMLDNEISVDCS